MWAGALGVGPGGGPLRATFEAGRSHQFQDRLGAAVLAMAGAVPDGMLCFLPSYSMLDALTARWKVRIALQALLHCALVILHYILRSIPDNARAMASMHHWVVMEVELSAIMLWYVCHMVCKPQQKRAKHITTRRVCRRAGCGTSCRR